MSVESQITKVVYSGNDATTVFPVPFPYSRPEHLKVMVTRENDTREETSNFKLELFENGDTNVIYPLSGDPLASAERLTIYRQTPRTQILDLIYGGAFSPETLEADGFDRLCMMVQELGEETGRAVRIPIDSTEEASLDKVIAQLSSYQTACAEIAEQVQAKAEIMDEQVNGIGETIAEKMQAVDTAFDEQTERLTNTANEKIQDLENIRDTARQYAENAESAASEASAAIENVAGQLATQTETVTSAMSAQTELVNTALDKHTEEMNAIAEQARQYVETLGDVSSLPKLRLIDSNAVTMVTPGDNGVLLFTGNGNPQIDLDQSLPAPGYWMIICGASRPRLVQKNATTGIYGSVGGSSYSTLQAYGIYMLVHYSNWLFTINLLSGSANKIDQTV